MLKSYLKTSLRAILKHKEYTAINLVGLTSGLTLCLLVFLLLRYEFSTDSFMQQADSIYRVNMQKVRASETSELANTPYPLAEAIHQDYVGSHNVFAEVTQLYLANPIIFETNDQKMKQTGIFFADSNFLNFFQWAEESEVWLHGNPKKALLGANKIVLTKTTAEKYFNNAADALGKTISLNSKIDVLVTGVVNNPPANTHLPYEVVISNPTLDISFTRIEVDTWETTFSVATYVKFASGTNEKTANAALKDIEKKYVKNHPDGATHFYVQALADIHFDIDTIGAITPSVSKKNLLIVALVGIFILVIACINYINLATSIASKKISEVGIRKIMGAKKRQLFWQFMGESMLVTLVSSLFSLALVERILPYYNNFLDKEITFDLLTDQWLLLFVATVTLGVGFISGAYPALVMSKFQPSQTLKSKGSSSNKFSVALRKFLVIFQFSIAQLLIVGTLIIAAQVDFLMEKPLGFNDKQVLQFNIPQPNTQQFDAFRQRLSQNAAIHSISFATDAPLSQGNSVSLTYGLVDGSHSEKEPISGKLADYYYQETFDIPLVAGRWYTKTEAEQLTEKDIPSGKDQAFVISRQAAKVLGFSAEESIGKRIFTSINDVEGEIIGVVEDFHIQSLHEEIKPILIMPLPLFYYSMNVKVDMQNAQAIINEIKPIWEEFYPENIFAFEYLDERVTKLYQAEQKLFDLFSIFTGLSLVICCLGLVGLVSFTVAQRNKEVGIRKVLGATSFQITYLFSKDFLKLVGYALIISVPLAWFTMNIWLQNFAYKIEISPWFFIQAIAISIFFALLTVGYQSIKAATTNPVDTLKDQ